MMARMSSSRIVLALATALLVAPAVSAQTNTQLKERAALARAALYNPTKEGLQGFHCNVDVDWKDLFSNATGTEIKPDNPKLKMFENVKIKVADRMWSGAEMTWTNPPDITPDLETSASMLRESMRQMLAGFFMSWNSFVNGSVVPDMNSAEAKDAKLFVETGQLHLKAGDKNMTVEEVFGDENQLVSLHVANSEMDIVTKPTYSKDQKGLLVTSLGSLVKMPVSSPGIASTMAATYGDVQGYKLPATISVEQGRYKFTLKMTGCEIDQPVSRAVTALP